MAQGRLGVERAGVLEGLPRDAEVEGVVLRSMLCVSAHVRDGLGVAPERGERFAVELKPAFGALLEYDHRREHRHDVFESPSIRVELGRARGGLPVARPHRERGCECAAAASSSPSPASMSASSKVAPKC